MAYMLLVMEDGDERRNLVNTEARRRMARMIAYGNELQTRGLLVGADSLKSDITGARVTVRSGKPMFFDGPFTEAKEIVGGYFIVNCAQRDEAVALAAECPAAEWSTVEVREIGPCYDE
ncbi:MAG: YciI family protein [Gammaproteobacteria bacterium]